MSALETQLLSDFSKIAKKKGLEYPFTLVLEGEVLKEPDGKLVDIKIEAGYPPTIVIPMIFIGRSILLKKDPILYRDRLERALEKLPIMTRSLSNNISASHAIVLVSDAKRWKSSRVEDHWDIPDSFFEVSFSVTVKERISGMEQTITGKNVKLITDEAKSRLKRIILNDEAMLNFRELVVRMAEVPKLEGKPKSISILTNSVDSNQTEEKRSY